MQSGRLSNNLVVPHQVQRPELLRVSNRWNAEHAPSWLAFHPRAFLWSWGQLLTCEFQGKAGAVSSNRRSKDSSWSHSQSHRNLKKGKSSYNAKKWASRDVWFGKRFGVNTAIISSWSSESREAVGVREIERCAVSSHNPLAKGLNSNLERESTENNVTEVKRLFEVIRWWLLQFKEGLTERTQSRHALLEKKKCKLISFVSPHHVRKASFSPPWLLWSLHEWH